MRVIRGYLFRSIIGTILLVLSVLMGLAAFIEFVTQLDDIGVGTYGVVQAFIYTLLKMPNYASQMLPMAVLLGALLGLGGLANHGELIILRAAGVSLNRLAVSVLWTGLVLSLFAFLLGSFVGPPLDNFARQFRAQAKHDGEAVSTGRSAWIRDGNSFLNVSRLTEDYRLGGVYIYRLNSDFTLASIGHADSAGVDDANQWVLSNLSESIFNSRGVKTSSSRRTTQKNNLSSDLVALTVVRPDSLASTELVRYISYLRSNDLDAQRYEVALWSRIAAAAAVAPMCVLALPFVFGRMRSSGAGARMVIGLLVGLAYFVTSRGLADGGQVYDLDPLFIAWLPTIALTVATMIALIRTR